MTRDEENKRTAAAMVFKLRKERERFEASDKPADKRHALTLKLMDLLLTDKCAEEACDKNFYTWLN